MVEESVAIGHIGRIDVNVGLVLCSSLVTPRKFRGCGTPQGVVATDGKIGR